MHSSPDFPDYNCCNRPRTETFIDTKCQVNPDCCNELASSFGILTSHLLIIGLAPGLKGANCIGRPSTGDLSDHLLYAIIEKL